MLSLSLERVSHLNYNVPSSLLLGSSSVMEDARGILMFSHSLIFQLDPTTCTQDYSWLAVQAFCSTPCLMTIYGQSALALFPC